MKNCYFWDKSYIIVNVDTVVVGGTADRGDYDTTTRASETATILAAACKLFPSLRTAEVVKEWAGLRPGRSKIRLELERRSGGGGMTDVVHCYGHGGSGVTLAWGCAGDVAAIVTARLAEHALLPPKL
jgi:D-amino-acid oxidase